MNLSKNTIRGILAAGILLAVYLIISLVVPFPKNGTWGVAFAFGIVAIAVMAAGIYLAFKDGEEAKSRFYGFPIAKIAVIYAGVQIVLSILFMALSIWVPLWIVLILSVLLLAAALLGLIGADMTREEVVRQEVVQVRNTKVMRGLQAQTESLAMTSGSTEIRKIADAFRYSDPVSNDATEDVEIELQVLVRELEKMTDENEIKTKCGEIERLLLRRNTLKR